MLADKNASANLAVKDIAVAKAFYQDTLGLRQIEAEGEEAIVYQSGRSR